MSNSVNPFSLIAPCNKKGSICSNKSSHNNKSGILELKSHSVATDILESSDFFSPDDFLNRSLGDVSPWGRECGPSCIEDLGPPALDQLSLTTPCNKEAAVCNNKSSDNSNRQSDILELKSHSVVAADISESPDFFSPDDFLNRSLGDVFPGVRESGPSCIEDLGPPVTRNSDPLKRIRTADGPNSPVKRPRCDEPEKEKIEEGVALDESFCSAEEEFVEVLSDRINVSEEDRLESEGKKECRLVNKTLLNHNLTLSAPEQELEGESIELTKSDGSFLNENCAEQQFQTPSVKEASRDKMQKASSPNRSLENKDIEIIPQMAFYHPFLGASSAAKQNENMVSPNPWEMMSSSLSDSDRIANSFSNITQSQQDLTLSSLAESQGSENSIGEDSSSHIPPIFLPQSARDLFSHPNSAFLRDEGRPLQQAINHTTSSSSKCSSPLKEKESERSGEAMPRDHLRNFFHFNIQTEKDTNLNAIALIIQEESLKNPLLGSTRIATKVNTNRRQEILKANGGKEVSEAQIPWLWSKHRLSTPEERIAALESYAQQHPNELSELQIKILNIREIITNIAVKNPSLKTKQIVEELKQEGIEVHGTIIPRLLKNYGLTPEKREELNKQLFPK